MSISPEHTLPRRVLIVDGDEASRESMSTVLRAVEFEVAVARDGAHALGARFLAPDEAKEALTEWLAQAFSGEERHQRRIEKIDTQS